MGGTYAASRETSKREGRFRVGFGVGHINKAQPIWSWLRPPFIPNSELECILHQLASVKGKRHHFFHIPVCSSLNLDELICTSPVSVRALNRSSARHHYASV